MLFIFAMKKILDRKKYKKWVGDKFEEEKGVGARAMPKKKEDIYCEFHCYSDDIEKILVDNLGYSKYELSKRVVGEVHRNLVYSEK